MTTREVIRVISHMRHDLKMRYYMKPYTCDGCKEKGFGPRYRCEECDYNLHEACAYNGFEPVSHEYFPRAKFIFRRTPPKACHPECKIRCDACRKTINGFVFHCEEDDVDLHPCCRNLQKCYRIDDVEFNLHKKVNGKCVWCKRRSLRDGGGADNGWSYVSGCGKYHVHVGCISDMALEEWNNSCNNYNNSIRRAAGSSSSSGSRSSSYHATSSRIAGQSLGVKFNLKEIEGRKNGGEYGNKRKYWMILKFIVKTIVSIVIGDPTMLLASFFFDAMLPSN